jgi:hypothetical protein
MIYIVQQTEALTEKKLDKVSVLIKAKENEISSSE